MARRGDRRGRRAVAGRWLDEALETGRGHPLLLAAIGTELGRRAGWQIAVCSSPAGWYAGLQQEGVMWLIDPTGETSGGGAPDTVRRHCAHEIAFVVLTGLADRFAGAHDQEHARSLRDRLSLFTPAEDAGHTLLGALWNEEER